MIVLHAKIGTCLHQHLDDRAMAAQDGKLQRRVTAPLDLRIQVRTRVDSSMRTILPASVLRGLMQCRVVVIVFRRQVGMMLDQ